MNSDQMRLACTTDVPRAAVERWESPEGQALAEKVIRSLRRGKSLRALNLPELDGRLDLRGLPSKPPSVVSTKAWHGLTIERLRGVVQVKHAHWRDLDLSGARLDGMLVVQSTIENCRFDKSSWKDVGLWASEVAGTSFVSADLRHATLGPWYKKRGNVYRGVDFTGADLRDLTSTSATYIDCDFSNAHLESVDFQSSSFTRCKFAGELREVIFWDHGFETGKPDPNPMQDVDFSSATLRWVEFRRLSLDNVRFPKTGGHLVVTRYKCVLRTVLNSLQGDESTIARVLRATFEHRLKWAGVNQDVGVFHVLDLGDDDDERKFAVDLIEDADRKCHSIPPRNV